MIRSHDETSEALLSAAHRLLADVGPEGLTVRRIATEAGMSTMNVYSRFGGKDGVIDELYVDGFQRLLAAIDAVAASDSIADDLLEVARAYRRFALANPAYYGIMFRSTVPAFEPSPESVEVALTSLASFVERIEIGQQRGEVAQVEGFPPVEMAGWLWATCHGLVSLELDAVGHERITWSSVFEQGMRRTISALHPSVAGAAAG
jgi:AcrR family transcriptional regulator